MSHRFFAPLAAAHSQLEITDAEAHHLLHVMRAEVGDSLVLFNGEGWEFPATITRLNRATVWVTTTDGLRVDRELPFRVTIGVALPKGDRQRWLIEKMVELGATNCVPLRTKRSVSQPEGGAPEKLRRAVIEASKQCGRNRLMDIQPTTPWSEFVEQARSATHRYIAHPDNVEIPTQSAPGVPGNRWHAAGGDDIWIAIGPEGGFTADEVELARATDWNPVSLGNRWLRIETATLAILAALALTPTT
ncbi:MAG: RsmE family RNA methyltransferase [Planctomycetota bacterium]